MKQKVSDPVTKAYLDDALKEYPTKQEVDEAFKTSEEGIRKTFDKKLADRLIASQNSFRAETQHDFATFRAEIDEKFSKFTDLILTAIDPLIKDLEIRREDREIATAQMKRIENDVDMLKKNGSQLQHS